MNKLFSMILEKIRTPQVFVWLALIIVAVFVWLYIDKTSPFLVSRDQFRFLRIIDAHYSSCLTWQEFFTSHSEHVKPGYLLLFYLNAIYLGLNIKVEMFAGLVALCLAAIVLVNQYRQSMKPHRSELFISITASILILQLFSYNQTASFSFSLLMFGGYTQLLLFLLIFRTADDLWLCRKDTAQLVKLIVLIFLTTFTFAGARMPIVMLALLFVPVLLFLLGEGERESLMKHGVILVLSGVVALGTYKLLLISPDRNTESEVVQRLIENPLGLWNFATNTIAASVIPAKYLSKHHGWEVQEFSFVGTVLLALMLFVVFVYLRKQLWRRSLMPLMMVLYGWGFVAAVVVARYGGGFPIQTAWSSRYVFDTQLAIIGTIWMFLLWSSQDQRLNKQGLVVVAAVGTFVVVIQAALATGVWNNAKSQVKIWEWAEMRMREEVKKPGSDTRWPRWYCPNDRVCIQGAHILQQNQLNLFRGDSEVSTTMGNANIGPAVN